MLTKTVRSRFDHEVGEMVEGCKIIEKTVIAPPFLSRDPSLCRRGIYDYVVEVPPQAMKSQTRAARTEAAAGAPSRESFVRTTPEEMGGRVIRRIR